jgi:hypothetical protein
MASLTEGSVFGGFDLGLDPLEKVGRFAELVEAGLELPLPVMSGIVSAHGLFLWVVAVIIHGVRRRGGATARP